MSERVYEKKLVRVLQMYDCGKNVFEEGARSLLDLKLESGSSFFQKNLLFFALYLLFCFAFLAFHSPIDWPI